MSRAWLLLLVGALVGGYTLDLRAPEVWARVRVPLLRVGGEEACVATDAELVTSSGQLQGGAVALYAGGFVRVRVCAPGRLSFVARGSLVDGRGPYLVVAWGDRPLFATEVREPRRVVLEVPGPGWLLLAFLNDAYRPPEDRNLWISGLSFVASP